MQPSSVGVVSWPAPGRKRPPEAKVTAMEVPGLAVQGMGEVGGGGTGEREVGLQCVPQGMAGKH